MVFFPPLFLKKKITCINSSSFKNTVPQVEVYGGLLSRQHEYSRVPGYGGSYLAGDSHHIVLRGAAPAQHHLVLASEEPIGGSHRGLLVQDTDGTVLPDAVGHFIGINPQGQLTGQQPM